MKTVYITVRCEIPEYTDVADFVSELDFTINYEGKDILGTIESIEEI